ncbi:MAG: hypothetical protein JWR59_551 [Brevundimonas sp.]|nr:hypothetical protein [Brevundimonas sp.]
MKQMIAAAVLTLSTLAAGHAAAEPRDVWFAGLTALCGQTFEGRVVTTDAADADFAGKRLTMKVRDCSTDEIRIPFAVGEDRSRTWVITRTADGMRLKHDHRGPDGKPDGLHWYGGTATEAGTDTRQDFPVDAFSVELFNAWDAQVSTTHVWVVEVHPEQMFAYELRRANRHFRVEFDLTRPVTD